jgi:hypothetical protein
MERITEIEALAAARKCLKAILAEQLSDGGFFHVSRPLAGDASMGFRYKTTFFAANILSCLNGCDASSLGILINSDSAFHESMETARAGAVQFLLSQHSPQWSFNYWAADESARVSLPYPDDLDDTFVAMAALAGYSDNWDGVMSAKAVRILTAAETTSGGPYQTWLIRDDTNLARDVDLAVNSNIAYFLSLCGVSLVPLTEFVSGRIHAGTIASPYYQSVFPVVYFISRWYRGDGVLIKKLLDTIFIRSGNLLDAALAISATINMGAGADLSTVEIKKFIDRIVAEDFVIAADNPDLFCMDPSRDGIYYGAGSSALTAAFCLEAVGKILSLQEIHKPASNVGFVPLYMRVLSRIKLLTETSLRELPIGLKENIREYVDDVRDEEIVAILYRFYEALGMPNAIAQSLLEELAVANLFGWIAYGIYDDFLDEENGDKKSDLLVANTLLRKLCFYYSDLNAHIHGILEDFQMITDGIDEANRREAARERCDDAEILCDKSLGHALPALAIVRAVGHASNSAALQATISFFKNYLIARQLHDDAHDWQDDLTAGRQTPVTAHLFSLCKKHYPDIFFQPGEILSKHEMSILRSLFWREAIPGIVEKICAFLVSARNAILSDHVRTVFVNPEPLMELVDRLEESAWQTLMEHATAITFIAEYQR